MHTRIYLPVRYACTVLTMVGVITSLHMTSYGVPIPVKISRLKVRIVQYIRLRISYTVKSDQEQYPRNHFEVSNKEQENSGPNNRPR